MPFLVFSLSFSALSPGAVVGMAGMTVRERSAPHLEGCALHSGEEGGLLVLEGGGGWLADCLIEQNTEVGVEIKGGGNPYLERCSVSGNGMAGLLCRQVAASHLCRRQRHHLGLWLTLLPQNAMALIKRLRARIN